MAHLIDLRSDTVTRPGPAMRQAMANAEVGDDVMGEDPTTRELQERVADLLGKESALYVTSGHMGNQLAIRVSTRPGDHVLVEEQAHIRLYEASAPAALSGVQLDPVPSEDGCPAWEAFAGRRHPDDPHFGRTSLVCLENTHNRHGGRVLDPDRVDEVLLGAAEAGLPVHLDGARLWNAAAASGKEMGELARGFRTVSVCFSKGLGAPVGSVLAGPRALIAEALRVRKQWGGGMRQSGILAAGCIYALDHQFQRLGEDQALALQLSHELRHPSLRLVAPPQTNLVLYDVVGHHDARHFAEVLREAGVLVSVVHRRRIRLSLHLDIGAADLGTIKAAIASCDSP